MKSDVKQEIKEQVAEVPLREKCSNTEFLFWSVLSRIRTEYREIRSISSHSVQTWENTDQKNSVFGHFLCSVPSQNLIKYNEKQACIHLIFVVIPSSLIVSISDNGWGKGFLLKTCEV